MTAEMVKVPALISRPRMIRMEINFFMVLCLPFLFDGGAIY